MHLTLDPHSIYQTTSTTTLGHSLLVCSYRAPQPLSERSTTKGSAVASSTATTNHADTAQKSLQHILAFPFVAACIPTVPERSKLCMAYTYFCNTVLQQN